MHNPKSPWRAVKTCKTEGCVRPAWTKDIYCSACADALLRAMRHQGFLTPVPPYNPRREYGDKELIAETKGA